MAFRHFTLHLSSFLALHMTGNTQVSFRTESDSNHFCIQTANGNAGPLPAAAWLFGSTDVQRASPENGPAGILPWQNCR